jgi:hypothetical protein
MKASSITISINYAGMQLPVVKNERGEDCTPLKPIVDLFGIQWEGQRRKVTSNPFLTEFLGVCTPSGWGAGGQKREETCILLSRVAAFLFSINPELVRSKGNETAADFLKQKLEEWADALHDYEELGIAIKSNHFDADENLRKKRIAVVTLINAKSKTATLADRKLLEQIIAKAASEIDASYQPDLLDGIADDATPAR